ncbi:DUF7845 domain-containing protein [Halodesulfurarchaeum formicicum]|nr:MarR family transcriptional regulator [Halodesulfurarchaeum formicicum]
METVQPGPHEFSANFLYNEHGLQPYFAADHLVKEGDGSQAAQFTLNGEQWVVKLYYQDSGILHPDRRAQAEPKNVDWRIDEVREFRLAVRRHPDEDDVGEQKANFHLAPRWQRMKAETKSGDIKEISVPPQFGIGINVGVKGSNIDFHRYKELLRVAAASVGFNSSYFDEPHPYSNTQDAEKYLRVADDQSGPIHARDGPIARMGHLLENDRSGYRKVVQNDRSQQGNNVPGYYHTVTLGPERVREAFPDHELPVEVKHYYTRNPESFSDSHPLSNPKLGASYQVNRWDEKIGVTDEELTQLERELDRIVLSVAADAGLDIAPQEGDGPFVEDAYWEIETSEAGANPIDLDLTRIRQESESVTVRQLADGLSPVQWETLETAVSDGGVVSPADVAEEHDRHINSVYRALAEIDDLLDRAYNQIALKNEHVAELVLDAVQRAKQTNERAFDAVASAKEAADRGLEAGQSAFVAWAAKHGIDVQNRDEARLVLRMEGLSNEEQRRKIRQGFELWTEANNDPIEYLNAKIDLGPRMASTARYYIEA